MSDERLAFAKVRVAELADGPLKMAISRLCDMPERCPDCAEHLVAFDVDSTPLLTAHAMYACGSVQETTDGRPWTRLLAAVVCSRRML